MQGRAMVHEEVRPFVQASDKRVEGWAGQGLKIIISIGHDQPTGDSGNVLRRSRERAGSANITMMGTMMRQVNLYISEVTISLTKAAYKQHRHTAYSKRYDDWYTVSGKAYTKWIRSWCVIITSVTTDWAHRVHVRVDLCGGFEMKCARARSRGILQGRKPWWGKRDDGGTIQFSVRRDSKAHIFRSKSFLPWRPKMRRRRRVNI